MVRGGGVLVGPAFGRRLAALDEVAAEARRQVRGVELGAAPGGAVEVAVERLVGAEALEVRRQFGGSLRRSVSHGGVVHRPGAILDDHAEALGERDEALLQLADPSGQARAVGRSTVGHGTLRIPLPLHLLDAGAQTVALLCQRLCVTVEQGAHAVRPPLCHAGVGLSNERRYLGDDSRRLHNVGSAERGGQTAEGVAGVGAHGVSGGDAASQLQWSGQRRHVPQRSSPHVQHGSS